MPYCDIINCPTGGLTANNNVCINIMKIFGKYQGSVSIIVEPWKQTISQIRNNLKPGTGKWHVNLHKLSTLFIGILHF